MKEETSLSRQCISWVENNGGFVVKLHGNEFQEAGLPDHIGAIEVAETPLEERQGLDWKPEPIYFAIELKLPEENATRIQEYQLKKFAKFGYRTGVAHSLEEYINIILGE